jgi:hypothetical protein
LGGRKLVAEVVEMTGQPPGEAEYSNEMEAVVCTLVLGERRHGI